MQDKSLVSPKWIEIQKTWRDMIDMNSGEGGEYDEGEKYDEEGKVVVYDCHEIAPLTLAFMCCLQQQSNLLMDEANPDTTMDDKTLFETYPCAAS